VSQGESPSARESAQQIEQEIVLHRESFGGALIATPEDVRKKKEEADRFIKNIVAMIFMIGTPAFITLKNITVAPDAHGLGDNPTPHGYTISLLLFLVPIAAMWYQLLRNHVGHIHRHALVVASGAITVIGFVLDLVFGHTFFTFKNRGATLGLRLPAWSFSEMAWVRDYLPIEEFAFYILGSLFMLTLYVWVERAWLEDEAEWDGDAKLFNVQRLVNVNRTALVLWILGVVGGLLYKHYLGRVPGFPGYFLFIMMLGFLPTVLFMNSVRIFINWRAFSMAYGILMFVQLLWEATLAIPFDWWNYKEPQMLGIRARAWHSMPMEASLLWIVVAFDCIIAFELCRVYFNIDHAVPVRKLLFGKTGARETVA
jgi:hypothetical protein